MTSACPIPVCAPHLRLASATAAQQVAIEPVVAAMMGDIVLNGAFRQLHHRADQRLDPVASAERAERLMPPRAGLEIFDGPALAESSTEASARRGSARHRPALPHRPSAGERTPHQLLLRPALDRLEAGVIPASAGKAASSD